MKALLSLICVLLAGILYLGIEFRLHRTSEARNDHQSTKTTPRPPILAQSSMFTYGDQRQGTVGFEGKIYNPNPFGLSNVRVRWQVYESPRPETAELFAKAGFEESCGFEFAFIPPFASYDFKTEKIKARTSEAVYSAGIGSRPAPMTDLKPKITFSVDP